MKNMRYILWSILCLSLFFSALTHAQDSQETEDAVPRYILDAIVVTASRTETPIKQVSGSIVVITADDIERSAQNTVAGVLRDAGGLSVVQTGGTGRNASVFLRGAESSYTLFMIDGVEVNDPMSPGRGYNPAHLSVDQVERIEVLYGPQSTLYGSDAIAGRRKHHYKAWGRKSENRGVHRRWRAGNVSKPGRNQRRNGSISVHV